MLTDNQCFICGRLGRDPEMKFTNTGKPYCKFSLACSYKTGEQEHTDWVPVQVWGKLAESCGSSLQKGQRAVVHGRFSSSSYETPQGKRYFTQVVADMVAICLEGNSYSTGGQKAQQPGNGNFAQFGQPEMEQTSFSDFAKHPQANPSGVMHGPGEKDEDIPF